MSDGKSGWLAWPPKKEDLERLYLADRLSAMKIADVYGLRCKNPKVAESIILYHLRRNGIKRRGCADHVRKVTETMVDEWARRYQAGESLKQIAGQGLSPVTVFLHLHKRGIKLRNKADAQIQAVTKYERKPFRGDGVEKAYLMGLRYCDLDAVRHGRAIRVRVSTTHPAMAQLFDSLFSPYGHVHWYPREAKLTGYEWTLECDLDASLQFLLKKPKLADLERLSDSEFLAFLAGFFDAEGSVFLHKKSSGPAPEANIANTDKNVLEFVAQRLRVLGVYWKIAGDEQDSKKSRFKSVSMLWRLNVWRFQSVALLLEMMPLRHKEKVEKAKVALKFLSPLSRPENIALVKVWENLATQIEADRRRFINEAGLKLGGIDNGTN